MNCPFCSNSETKVTDKRDDDNDSVTRRRRQCLSCGKRFTTYERVECLDIFIIKKDGSKQKYDRLKLEAGILKACKNRPCLSTAETLVDQVENEIRQSNEKEVSSRLVGEMVIKRLKVVDPVAYMRFTSVYRSFNDLDSFEEELNQLKNEK